MKTTNKRTGNKKESGGFGFFVFLLFLIFVLYDGNLETNFGDLSYSYWFFSWLKGIVLIGIVAFFGFLGYGFWILRQPD